MLEYWLYVENQHNMADHHMNRTVSPSVLPVRERNHLSLPVPSSVTAIATTVSSMVSSFMTETCSLTGSMCSATSSAWNTFSPTSRNLHCSDQDPVSAAAHLHLLGESLSLIGLHLQETNKRVCMSSGFSLLLDSLLCALAPLICLTSQIPELKSCTRHTLASTLENIAYLMPGL
ncbi:HMG box-containing protein 4 [Stegastes partitus]|uniref:HMG box-containing protein 4 n=1 Tax=Stegastes partitus TaxID=144197 RepID=A0A9Y4MVL9_9TELE|nr:PREDICTED: HMG box-containing protein 4-like [Stegastes partitus]